MLKLNGRTVHVTMFPDKTSQVWNLTESFQDNKAEVVWTFEHEGEFMHLVQLCCLIPKTCYKVLTLEYLPYARQDKEIDNHKTFALRPFSALLNTLGFEEVRIIDPHSLVSFDLIKNSCGVYPMRQVFNLIKELNIDVVCYPDKGALIKYQDKYGGIDFIYGEKERDQLTGRITKYQLVGDPKNRNVLIIDDICDGGMTFKILAKDLLAAGAKSVVLFVTHGLFSKGLQTLKDSGIQRIYTKDGEAV